MTCADVFTLVELCAWLLLFRCIIALLARR